jgi:hypothetical protein
MLFVCELFYKKIFSYQINIGFYLRNFWFNGGVFFFFIINTINSPTTSLHKSNYTQNPFEINLTIVGVKIRHDFKWDYHNPLLGCENPTQSCARTRL